jgi:hypothetical protein
VSSELADALKAEARNRIASGTFFGHIAYASVLATRPHHAPGLPTSATPKLATNDYFDLISPKLRPVRWAIPGLTWCSAGLAWWRSGYFKLSGIGTPMSVKASRWALVGSASIGTVAWAPANRTWLRVKVARCSSRPRKL